MKKVITTAMILGSLMNVANAMDSMTSPLYKAKDGEVYSRTKLGFIDEEEKLDPVTVGVADISADFEAYVIRQDMSFGVTDKYSIDFGFNHLFDQEYEIRNTTNTINDNYEDSSSLGDFYIGSNYRFLDNMFKLDVGGKLSRTREERNSTELYVMGGYAWDRYEIALTAGFKYGWEKEDVYIDNINSTTTTYLDEEVLDYYLVLENEFEVMKDKLFIGLDVGYEIADDRESTIYTTATNKTEDEERDTYYVSGDFNWKINDNIAVGLYTKYSEADDSDHMANSVKTYELEDLETWEYGLKLDTLF